MRKGKVPVIRHCHECGRPIGAGRRGVILCRVCENELVNLLRSDENIRGRNERRDIRFWEDSVFLDEVLAQNRKHEDARRRPPRRREWLSAYEALEMEDVTGLIPFPEDRDAEVA